MKLYEHLNKHGITSQDFAAERMRQTSWDGTMTAMQDEVLESDAFWDTSRNLVIQGATSSGKTLLAEIAAYRQIINEESKRRKVIFLVPLRALVTAQCNQLARDFADVRQNGEHLKIFESSADYQDHDSQILGGDYDIAVIVYEKFFALLSSEQRGAVKMLSHCGLVVVDELQMLSAKDRGPKMEFSIMRLLEMQPETADEIYEDEDNTPNETLRIIGLTTSESDTDNLCRWMHAKKLGNSVRPVPLLQSFISCENGKVKRRYIPGERDVRDSTVPEEVSPEGEVLEIRPAFNALRKMKDRYFFSLLSELLDEDGQENKDRLDDNSENEKKIRNKKILIFVNSRRSAQSIANEIANRFPTLNSRLTVETQSEHSQILAEFRDEEGINSLSTLIPRGVAFHHSGLPSTVRTLIEDDFANRDGQIQIIVCTETLMIGMNLPADIVILYDETVYRGAGEPEELTIQAYNNFVGRAGRLGLNDSEKYRGESYMLTDSIGYDFKRFTADKQTKIKSPFKLGDSENLAPFYLNWIGNAPDANMRIRTGLNLSLNHSSSRGDNQLDLKNVANDILEKLKNVVNEPDKSLITQDKTRLSNYGKALAPYALSLGTCRTLLEYIREKPVSENELLFDVTDTDAGDIVYPPKKLLELVYTVCACSEVDRNPALNFTGGSKSELKTLHKRAQEYLKNIYTAECKADQNGWRDDPGSKLCQLTYSDFLAEPEDLNRAIRTLVLCLWLAGYRVKRIKDILKLSGVMVTTSDIERLSEVAAFLIEAAGKCHENNLSQERRPYLFKLSVQMKYGVPFELCCLASTHVRGLTRNSLLTILRRANQAHKAPRDYIMASSESHYQPLRLALVERDRVNNYSQQIDNIRSEDSSGVCNPLLGDLHYLDHNSGFGADGCREAICNIMQNISDFCNENHENRWSIIVSPNDCEFTFLRNDGFSHFIRFKVFDMGENSNVNWAEQISAFYHEPARSMNQRLVKIAVLYGTPPLSEYDLPDDMLVISSEFLGVLLGRCIRDCVGSKMLEVLCCMLSDLKGEVILNGTTFFNSFSSIADLIKNYLHGKPESGKPGLLYYSGVVDPGDDSPCAAVPWGNNVGEDEMPCGSLIAFFHPSFLFSRTAEKMLDRCDYILCSEGDYDFIKGRSSLRCKPIPLHSDIDEILEIVVNELHRPENSDYEFDFGISLRTPYLNQMKKLKDALERRGKKVLLMETDDFAQRMAGRPLIISLRKEFSKCRHIIICNTKDYDQGPYTILVEFGVIWDRISSAIRSGKRFPIHRVNLPGVETSEVIDSIIPDLFHPYDEGNVDKLAIDIIRSSQVIDEDNAHIASLS